MCQLIHNVMGTDFVIGVSDKGSDALNMVFNTVAGRSYLARYRNVGQRALADLDNLGLSSIANILGAIKYAKYMALGADDIVLTVATDGAAMYRSELESAEASRFAGTFSEIEAAEAFGQHVLGAGIDHVSELTRFARERIFNLGYYTWVEQQDTRLEDFGPAARAGILGRSDGPGAGLGRHDRAPERRDRLAAAVPDQPSPNLRA